MKGCYINLDTISNDHHHHGWLIHQKRSGSSSLRLTVLSKHRGLISCMYRGGANVPKKSRPELFQPCWYQFDEKHYGTWVKTCEPLALAPQLSHEQLMSALYINEIIYYSLRYDDPHVLVFDAYSHTMNVLVESSDGMALQGALRRFEYSLLHACGYGLVFEEAGGMPLDETAHYHYDVDAGFKKAKTGYSGVHLLALSRDELTDANVMKTAKSLMRHAIHHLVGGRDIKTRTLWSTS